MTFLLVSCGGGKSTATLTISKGMFLSNTSFSGGIYITGEMTDGSERFARAISSGNIANVSISFGTWNIKVIGWDGGTMSTGTPYCKYVGNFQFMTEGQALEITTSTSECFATHDQISGTNQHVTAHSGPFRNLVVSTCGAHYNKSSPSNTIAIGYSDECSDPGYPYPLEFRKKYSYFQLHLENELRDGTRSPGIVSSCLSAQFLGQTVKFPNRMPVTMKFYTDSSCTNEIDSFRFKKGMDFALSEGRGVDSFDWSVTAGGINFFVYLPTGASKRMTTAFHSETPQFKCNDGTNNIPCPKLVAGAANTYYLDPDSYAVIKVPQTSCSLSRSYSISVTEYSCDEFKGQIYIGLKANSLTPTSGSLSVNGASYALTVGNANSGKAEDRVRDAYKTLKRVLGIRNTVNFDSSLQDDFDEGDNPAMGLLDPAIYELSPMGAGGTFFDYYNQCGSGALARIDKSYVKDGINYTVHLSGIALNTPGFISEADYPEDIAPQLRLNRRIIVRKLLGGTYTTEKVIDISCDNDTTNDVAYTLNSAQVRTGKMEEQRTYSLGANNVTLKKLIYWNVSKSGKSRFDIYRHKRVASSSDTTQKIEKNFYRAVKADGDENHFKIFGMTYEVVREGSSYDESILVNEIDGIESAGTVNYSHKRLTDYKIENTSVGEIFGTTFGQELGKIKYGFRPTQSEAEQTSIASSGEEFIEIRPGSSNFTIRYTDAGSIVEPSAYGFTPDNLSTDVSANGLQKIAVTNNGTTIYLYHLINNVWGTSTLTAGTSQIISLKTKILDDGTYIVAWMEDLTLDQVYWSVNGGAVQSSPYTFYLHEKLALIKDSSFFYLSFVRTYSSDPNQQSYDMCFVNGSTACGFQQIGTKNSASHYSYHSAIVSGSTIYHTYIHDGQVQTMSAASNVLNGGIQNNSPYVRKFNEYQIPFYSNLDSTTLIRTGAGTTVDNYYRYYSPTIPSFQMKPSSLKESYFGTIFTSSFGSLTN